MQVYGFDDAVGDGSRSAVSTEPECFPRLSRSFANTAIDRGAHQVGGYDDVEFCHACHQLVQILGVPTPAVEFDCQPGMSAHQLLSQLLGPGLVVFIAPVKPNGNRMRQAAVG